MKSIYVFFYRYLKYGLIFPTFFLLSLPSLAQKAPVCGDEVKAEFIKALDDAVSQYKDLSEDLQLQVQAGVYKKYFDYCSVDSQLIQPIDPIYTAATQCGAKLSYLGSIFYEEMSCCGYDPQRRTFACPVKIKQPFGFGGSPLPGSREYVLSCVADTFGVYQPVAVDSVHLSNSVFAPTWQFAVLANANMNLSLVQPMNGAPRRARSILSWGIQPTKCDFKPIWGTVLDYQIRLDQ